MFPCSLSQTYQIVHVHNANTNTHVHAHNVDTNVHGHNTDVDAHGHIPSFNAHNLSFNVHYCSHSLIIVHEGTTS
jgi:hypothetical protein